MIDTSTPKGKLIEAALRLAETRKWSDISLLDIAEAAQMPLVEVRKAAGSKSQLLAGFMRAVDDHVLKTVAARAPDQPARDLLFEVIMARFDALSPYKAAVKSIHASGMTDTTLIMPFLNSQRWMLTAAGVQVDGPSGIVRTLGLGSLYAGVFSTWLSDDDPGMARTMAALDYRLRSGERTISALDGAMNTVHRLVTDIPAVFRAACTRRAAAPTPAPAGEEVKPV